jgi:uncharacterized FlgJ-related protein
MNNRPEDRSLLEVREWKEQCRQEDQTLSPTEYLEKLRTISEQMKSHYHLHLQKVSRSQSVA